VPPTGDKSPAGRDEGIQVLRRAAAALDEIAAEPGRLRLVDLGERLGLAKSTARRLMVGLVEVGLANVDAQGRFSLGQRLLGLGRADGAQISAVFRPTIERVARATDGETVDLSILRGQRMWFIDQIESSHRLRAVSAVGVRFPLESTANGKAALAALDDAEAEAIVARFAPEVAGALRHEIAEIRRSGVAFDRDEHTAGISAAAIARRDAGGIVVAISVPAPTERFRAKERRIVNALRAAADSPAWTR
jgi:DNA-binding IclR family transcriptional regulator